MHHQNLSGKKAIIYCRVSTIEQGLTGFSLDYQEKSLVKFCKENNITVVQKYRESHSGKTFNRPQFNILYEYVMKNAGEVDYILTTKWDRFSRNSTEADIKLEIFAKLGISVNAIHEWRNMDNVTEWMMYKISMTFAEGDNRNRSEKVTAGIHKANEDGRYVGSQPRGYMPGKDENNKTLMQPDPETAPMIKALLEDYSTGNYSQNALLKKYRALGLNISKSALSRTLANPLYAGLVKVKAHMGEPERLVRGLHIPLINESTYKRIQYYLKKKNRLKQKPCTDDNNLPLRGKILKCPNCGRNLTGYTKTKPNGKQYHYYNCDARLGCGFSCNATEANKLFVERLNQISPSPQVAKLFERLLLKKYESMNQTRGQELSLLEKRKGDLTQKLDALTEKLVEGKIREDAYERVYNKYEQEIEEIELQIANLPQSDEPLEKYLKFALSFISQLGNAYENADIKTKKMILSSILSGNPVFDGEKYRTLPLNEVVALLSKYSKGFKNKGTKKGGFFSETSRSVPRIGHISNFLEIDLRSILESERA